MGGIAAVVASGWTQVKNIFSYLSSFIIVTAEIDQGIAFSIIYHLRSDWKLLPSGKLVYRCRYLWLFTQRTVRKVPFRVPATTAVYRKGKKILFINGGSEGLVKITYLRGAINMDEFVSTALDQSNNRDDEHNGTVESQNRYMLRILTGREKGMFDMGDMNKPNNNYGSSPSVNSADSAASMTACFLTDTIDKSFKYSSDEWMQSTKRDPFKSLYYPEHVEKYINQAIRWKGMGEWYADRSIPWRRGWLLHGGPGTGKTSLANGVAKRLGIPIYIYNLNTMSDQELIRFWDEMETPCMALFEDFDNVFHGREAQTEHKQLSFDCILNTIGGAKAAHGVFLVVTTNCLDKIDPAMGVTWGTEGNKEGISSRPGRIDSVIELSSMEYEGRLKLASRILVDWPEAIAEIVADGQGCSPVQFQEMCLQYANNRMEEQVFALPTATTSTVVATTN